MWKSLKAVSELVYVPCMFGGRLQVCLPVRWLIVRARSQRLTTVKRTNANPKTFPLLSTQVT
jgi:hypothetical protein